MQFSAVSLVVFLGISTVYCAEWIDDMGGWWGEGERGVSGIRREPRQACRCTTAVELNRQPLFANSRAHTYLHWWRKSPPNAHFDVL